MMKSIFPRSYAISWWTTLKFDEWSASSTGVNADGTDMAMLGGAGFARSLTTEERSLADIFLPWILRFWQPSSTCLNNVNIYAFGQEAFLAYLPSQSIFPTAFKPAGYTVMVFVSSVNLLPSLASNSLTELLKYLRISHAEQGRCV